MIQARIGRAVVTLASCLALAACSDDKTTSSSSSGTSGTSSGTSGTSSGTSGTSGAGTSGSGTSGTSGAAENPNLTLACGATTKCDPSKELCSLIGPKGECAASQHTSCDTVTKAYNQICVTIKKVAVCQGDASSGFTVSCQ